MAIIAIVVAMLLPAVQQSREAARKIRCSNNLRQVAIGFHYHQDAHRFLPSDGWGWTWAPETQRGAGRNQPGGWCYHVLPFLEQEALHARAAGDTDAQRRQQTAELLASPLPLFYCPSRRSPALYPYTLAAFPLVNSDPVTMAAKTDYAVNAGDRILHTPPGPPSADPSVVAGYAWPPLEPMTGVSFVRSEITLADLHDGASNVIMLGEKCVNRLHYQDGKSLGDDADIRRWTMFSPRRDPANYDEIQLFGSAHDEGCYFAFGDCSVRWIRYAIDQASFRHLGNRYDGQPVEPPAF